MSASGTFKKSETIGCLWAALPVVIFIIIVFGSITFQIGNRAAQVENFDRAHRLVREMHAVSGGISISDSSSARVALLRFLPPATKRDTAIAELHKEGFECETIVGPRADNQLHQHYPLDGKPNKIDLVDCQLKSPSPIGYFLWTVELEFDTEQQLNDARVSAASVLF